MTLAWLIPAVARGQVVINEMAADNQTTLLNEGIYPDWMNCTIQVDYIDSLEQPNWQPASDPLGRR